MSKKFDVIVVGAGISGLSCAKSLREAGKNVLVLEKSRGTGGRLASKRLSTSDWGVLAADLGCEALSGGTQLFQDHLQMWERLGVVSYWPERKGWSVVEKSSQVTRCLSQGIPLQCETRVTRIEPVECGVAVLCEKGQRLCAEQAIISAPPAQAGWLLESAGVEAQAVRKELAQVKMLPQWVVLMAIDPEQKRQWEARAGEVQAWGQGVVDAMTLETVKPGRRAEASAEIETLVLRLTTEWSRKNEDQEAEKVIGDIKRWCEQVGFSGLADKEALAHRWLYSRVDGRTCLPGFFRACGGHVYLCGDYFDLSEASPSMGGDRGRGGPVSDVERAFLSGVAVAEASLTGKFIKSANPICV